jgi:hypothetical protein
MSTGDGSESEVGSVEDLVVLPDDRLWSVGRIARKVPALRALTKSMAGFPVLIETL